MTDEPRGKGAPTPEDERHDDFEYNPQLEPNKSKAWLNLLLESEDAFKDWNDHCDRIDRQYASLVRLSNMARDKEFQMFWANAEVIKPTIYAKQPTPVVVPKFKDRRPVYQAASEVMERCCVVAFDLAHINDLMLAIRDDVALISRGVAWCRYESGKGDGYYVSEKVCIDFKNRRDFLHSISRTWSEVTWVAAASYLTRAEARKRFHKHSGDAYQEADYKVDKDSKEVGGADARERAKFWEIWDKSHGRVLWVSEGCEDILDEDDAHLELQDFFPCPKPAYGTVQRGSLIPVPDVLQYKDQLDEINLLTGRIHALSDAVEVKGFYPAGGGELADAIQHAINIKTPGRVMVPISNWAAFGGSKDVIIWMPIDMIAQTITVLIEMRKQVIQDIYEITGLSDIMRGSTDARETLGAQQLKSQFGSTRIRDKQQELVRFARDLVVIASEIITEKFDPVTIIEMSQTQLPTMEMQRTQAMQIQQQLEQQKVQIAQAKQMAAQQQAPPPGPPPPGLPPGAKPVSGPQPDPQQAQQLQQAEQELIQSGEDAIKKIMARPTIEQVLHFLKDNRAKAFTLDIETDSTIMIDENAEKQRRTEFVGVLGQLLPQLAQLVASDPNTADFAGEVLKFATAPFRAGRSLDGSIDELVESVKNRADKGKKEDPIMAQNKTALQIEQMKDATNKEKNAQDMQIKQAELQMRNQHEQAKIASNERMKAAELQARQQDDAARARQTNLKAMADREKHQADLIKKQEDIKQTVMKGHLAAQAAQHKQQDMAQRSADQRAAQQFKLTNPPQRGGP